ncbi:MAG TPA: lysine 2,3-aminomutase, partial [Bacteroidales bacterium]|nr:lysine 2,3-aminomutase [Bacteroidales bacterium]
DIRIDTKMLGYWPYRFTTDSDSNELLALFERINASGKHLVIMANFNHPVELSTKVVKEAIKAIRNTGTTIQTQSPILKNINDSPEIWKKMWNEQVKLGCIPYEMYIPRNTGTLHYFSVSLVNAWEIFRDAFKNVSGLCRTVRGPCMSCDFGKIQILGINETPNGKVISLRLVQGKNPEWVMKLFLAEYNEKAIWIDELIPAFGQKQFSFEGIEHEEVELEDSYNYALAL